MDEVKKTQKVVLVEDSVELAEIYKTRIELLGYTCFVAGDGITALYLIQNELPNLVLLDLMVPNIAGDQILFRMRNSSWGKNIPVIIISNLNEADAPAGLRDLGISGYAVKANLSYDQFDKLVTTMLVANHQSTTLETPAPGAIPATPATPVVPPIEPTPPPAAPEPALPNPPTPPVQHLESEPQTTPLPPTAPEHQADSPPPQS